MSNRSFLLIVIHQVRQNQRRKKRKPLH